MIKKVDFLGDTKREICHRIHSHFVPQSKTDESVTLSSLDLGKSKRPECFKWNRGTQVLSELIEPGVFTDEQIKLLLECLVTKLVNIAKDAVVEAHSIAAFSIKNLILKILNLNLASRTDLVFVINSISEVMSNCAQLHTSLFGVLLSILTGKGSRNDVIISICPIIIYTIIYS